jgi:hypothetical protein
MERQASCELCPLLQAKNEVNDQAWKLILPETIASVEASLDEPGKNQNTPLNLTNRGPPRNS